MRGIENHPELVHKSDQPLTEGADAGICALSAARAVGSHAVVRRLEHSHAELIRGFDNLEALWWPLRVLSIDENSLPTFGLRGAHIARRQGLHKPRKPVDLRLDQPSRVSEVLKRREPDIPVACRHARLVPDALVIGKLTV